MLFSAGLRLRPVLQKRRGRLGESGDGEARVDLLDDVDRGLGRDSAREKTPRRDSGGTFVALLSTERRKIDCSHSQSEESVSTSG